MGNITVEQVANFIITFGAVLTAGGVICKVAISNGKKILDKSLDKSLEPFDRRITELSDLHEKQYQALSLQTDKNYLVRFLADVEKGETVDETELEHFYFTYDDYHRHNGNSYIDHKVDKLKKEGKL